MKFGTYDIYISNMLNLVSGNAHFFLLWTRDTVFWASLVQKGKIGIGIKYAK